MKKGTNVSISPAYSVREEIINRHAAKCTQEILLTFMEKGKDSLSVIVCRNMAQLIDDIESEKVLKELKPSD